jgi:alanyl-tRNA synthetase
MGSDITAERLRFDFNFSRKLTEEEVRLTEEFINSVIARDISVIMKEEDHDTAVKDGALAFFKAKYPARVKVYSIEGVSKELCGGPHVARTGEIGKFKIVKDEAVAAGVRRLRAIVQ